MAESYTFFIPGRPKARAQPWRSPAGHYVPDKASEKYKTEGKVVCQNGRPPFFEGAVRATVIAYREIPASWPKYKRQKALAGELLPTSKPDADNYTKMALDICTSIVFKDDAQVVEVLAKKLYVRPPQTPDIPGLQVTIRTV